MYTHIHMYFIVVDNCLKANKIMKPIKLQNECILNGGASIKTINPELRNKNQIGISNKFFITYF